MSIIHGLILFATAVIALFIGPNAIAQEQLSCVGYTSLVRNGGFDTWAIATDPPDEWSVSLFGGGSFSQDSIHYLSAPYSASIGTNDFGQLALLSQSFTSTDTLYYKVNVYATPTYEQFIRTPCYFVSNVTDITTSSFYFYDFASTTWHDSAVYDIGRGLNCAIWNFTPDTEFQRMDYPLFKGMPSTYGTTTYINFATIVPLGATSFDNAEYGSCDQVVTTTEIMLTSTTTLAIEQAGQNSDFIVKLLIVVLFIIIFDLLRRILLPKTW